MTKYFFIFLLGITLLACQKKTSKPPIDRDTYKNILKEVILTNIVKQELKKKDSLETGWLSLVYKKYQIDSIKLEKTTEYYSQHPEDLQKIYEEIYQDIKKTSDSLDKLDPQNISKPQNDKIKVSKKALSEIKKSLH